MQIVSQVTSVSYSHFPAHAPARLALPPPPERLRLNAPPARLMLPAPRIEIQQRSHSTHAPTYQADLMAALGPIRSREAMNAELAELASGTLRDLRTMRAQMAEALAAKGRRS